MIKAGVPAALVTTTAFRTLADSERRAKGAPDLPLLMIDHPLGGEKIDGVRARAAQAVQALVRAIAEPVAMPGTRWRVSLLAGERVG